MPRREATGSGPKRAGDIIGSLFGAGGAGKLSSAQRAARGWFSANGDRERAHTTGVWLRKPGCAGKDPVMVVRLDSNLLAQELATNKELYLARLARVGVAVSDLRFEVGRARGPGIARGKKPKKEKPPLPDLRPADLARIEHACADLPEGLRESVFRAMRATIARERQGQK